MDSVAPPDTLPPSPQLATPVGQHSPQGRMVSLKAGPTGQVSKRWPGLAGVVATRVANFLDLGHSVDAATAWRDKACRSRGPCGQVANKLGHSVRACPQRPRPGP